jgi:hypothetical protein
MGGHELDVCGSGQGDVADSSEPGKELLGDIKCREFLD